MIHERKQVQTCISRDRNRVKYGCVSVAYWTVIVCLTVLYYTVIGLFCTQCSKKTNWTTLIMGRKGDLSPRKKAEVKALVTAKTFSNREISRRLEVSEASVRRIKKKIELGEVLSPKRKKRCGRKPIFTPRSERCLKNICLENRFATTKVIKSRLQDASVNVSERTVRRKLKDLDFKAYRPARKPKLTAAMKTKRLQWAKQWQDKDVDFWRSVRYSNLIKN